MRDWKIREQETYGTPRDLIAENVAPSAAVQPPDLCEVSLVEKRDARHALVRIDFVFLTMHSFTVCDMTSNRFSLTSSRFNARVLLYYMCHN